MNDRMSKECQSSKKSLDMYAYMMWDFRLRVWRDRVYLDRQCRLARNMINFQTTFIHIYTG